MRRLAAIFLLALVAAPLASAAAKTPVFGLRAVGNPKLGYFVYPLTPGSVQQGGVIISNTGTAAGSVKLFTADATTGRTTGTVYLTDRKPTKVGAWVSLSATSLTLKPGQHQTVHFTVHVPTNAKPGQWVGGIVAETSRQLKGPKSKQKASVQINIRDLTIVAVQVNVPGHPVSSFQVGAVKTGGQRGFQQLITHIASNGNVLVKPTGTVTVFDKQGAKIQTLPFKMDTFLPETEIDYPLLLKKALPPGDYTATVRLVVPAAAGAAAQLVSAHPSFSISKQDVQQVFTSAAPQTPPPGATGTSASSTPWALYAGIAGIVVLLLLLLWLLIRRRRRETVSRPPTVVQRSASAAAAEAPQAPTATSEADLLARTAPPPPPPMPAEPVAAAPPEPAPAPVAPPAPAPAAPSPPCDHFWAVAYDRGQLGEDGIWRFPHRCSNCGLELLAADVADATAQANARS